MDFISSIPEPDFQVPFGTAIQTRFPTPMPAENTNINFPRNGYYNNGETTTTTSFSDSFSSCQDFGKWTTGELDAFELDFLSTPEYEYMSKLDLTTLISSKSEEQLFNYRNAMSKDLTTQQHQMQLSESAVAPLSIPLPESTLTTELKGDTAEKTNKSKQRRGVWSKEEHQMFLRGLKKHGKGDWKSIERYMEFSRSSIQIASHAQKFFLRSKNRHQTKRRSIHDITTVDDNDDTGAKAMAFVN